MVGGARTASSDTRVTVGREPVLGGFLRGAEEVFWRFNHRPLVDGVKVLGQWRGVVVCQKLGAYFSKKAVTPDYQAGPRSRRPLHPLDNKSRL